MDFSFILLDILSYGWVNEYTFQHECNLSIIKAKSKYLDSEKFSLILQKDTKEASTCHFYEVLAFHVDRPFLLLQRLQYQQCCIQKN